MFVGSVRLTSITVGGGRGRPYDRAVLYRSGIMATHVVSHLMIYTLLQLENACCSFRWSGLGGIIQLKPLLGPRHPRPSHGPSTPHRRRHLFSGAALSPPLPLSIAAGAASGGNDHRGVPYATVRVPGRVSVECFCCARCSMTRRDWTEQPGRAGRTES